MVSRSSIRILLIAHTTNSGTIEDPIDTDGLIDLLRNLSQVPDINTMVSGIFVLWNQKSESESESRNPNPNPIIDSETHEHRPLNEKLHHSFFQWEPTVQTKENYHSVPYGMLRDAVLKASIAEFPPSSE
ncbi:hypothetical protein GEMRC1_011118 [Eukaryota sp. GEM-RC1]